MDIKKHEALSFSNSLPPPPAYSTTSGSQTYDVDYRNWRYNILIRDSTGQPLFDAAGHRCSTRLEITDRNNQIIGTSKRSQMSSKIEVSMTSPTPSAFEMHNSLSIMGGSPKYTSPAFGGAEMTWKNDAMSTKIMYTLIDGRGMSIAKFTSNRRTQIGKLELMDDVAGEERLNEVAVTILTLLHRKLRNIQASYIAAVT